MDETRLWVRHILVCADSAYFAMHMTGHLGQGARFLFHTVLRSSPIADVLADIVHVVTYYICYSHLAHICLYCVDEARFVS